jgi:hypothetical protein
VRIFTLSAIQSVVPEDVVAIFVVQAVLAVTNARPGPVATETQFIVSILVFFHVIILVPQWIGMFFI